MELGISLRFARVISSLWNEKGFECFTDSLLVFFKNRICERLVSRSTGSVYSLTAVKKREISRPFLAKAKIPGLVSANAAFSAGRLGCFGGGVMFGRSSFR
jgi:hypothetical protein